MCVEQFSTSLGFQPQHDIALHRDKWQYHVVCSRTFCHFHSCLQFKISDNMCTVSDCFNKWFYLHDYRTLENACDIKSNERFCDLHFPHALRRLNQSSLLVGFVLDWKTGYSFRQLIYRRILKALKQILEKYITRKFIRLQQHRKDSFNCFLLYI
jgi:hypothetical protein